MLPRYAFDALNPIDDATGDATRLACPCVLWPPHHERFSLTTPGTRTYEHVATLGQADAPPRYETLHTDGRAQLVDGPVRRSAHASDCSVSRGGRRWLRGLGTGWLRVLVVLVGGSVEGELNLHAQVGARFEQGRVQWE